MKYLKFGTDILIKRIAIQENIDQHEGMENYIEAMESQYKESVCVRD